MSGFSAARGDRRFLQRVFHKLLLNYAWWINRKDRQGQNVFEGGFLGLDNISVFDRSQPLPPGYTLKQADATGWMAMFALNMTVIALELAIEDGDYENIAIQCYEQFLAIAKAISGGDEQGLSLWDQDSWFLQGSAGDTERGVPADRRLFMGGADSPVRHRSGGPASAGACASLP